MRNIPAQLLAHKQQDATTLCQLIKVLPKNEPPFGMTTLDRDITYDDGNGPLLYKAAVGFQPASIYSSADFGVDNSEFQSLVPEFDLELDEYKVNAGVYDYAQFYMYEVNYLALSQGHWIVMSGTLGQMKSVDGLSLFGELRSRMDEFRKPLCQLDSLGCRALFGSQPGGPDRFPCGYDTTPLWMNGTVTSVGLESTRTFTDTSRTEVDAYFEPGMIQWLTGMNAGKYMEIETSLATGEISLNHPLPYPISIGDTYRIRVDCNKQARHETKGCKSFFGTAWPLHFRGEPDIPLGDAGSLTTPGAGVGPGSGGSTSTPFDESEAE